MAEPETQEQKEPVLTPIDRGEGHPHWGKHLTREDVLLIIEESGGPELLDLAGAILRDVGSIRRYHYEYKSRSESYY